MTHVHPRNSMTRKKTHLLASRTSKTMKASQVEATHQVTSDRPHSKMEASWAKSSTLALASSAASAKKKPSGADASKAGSADSATLATKEEDGNGRFANSPQVPRQHTNIFFTFTPTHTLHPGSPLYTTDSRTYLTRHHDDISLSLSARLFSLSFLVCTCIRSDSKKYMM